MKKITVAARRNSPSTWNYKIFSNAPDTRPVRTTQPDITKLTDASRWLVNSLPDCSHLHGRTTTSLRVFCYSGLTEKQRLLAEAKTDSQREYVEKLSRCYGAFLDQLERIDWLFPIIEPEETDEHYWNRVAQEMASTGVTKIVIRDGSAPELVFDIPNISHV
ncbi:hypothetical protein FNH69_22095 [Salmonella enterica subsp. salamae]|nr:hypothetical protein [Salmonella enterica subsp. salamae]